MSDGAPDVVYVHGLEVRSIIGVDEWERSGPQRILIDVDLACDAARPAASDDVDQAINYRTVAKAVQAHVEATTCRLVETLAVQLVDLIRDRFGVPWVRVRVGKPGAVRFSREVGVIVERGKRPAAIAL